MVRAKKRGGAETQRRKARAPIEKRRLDVFEVISDFQGREFSYGDEDCCQFLNECIKAWHGKDPAKPFSYSDEGGAQKILDEHGGITGLLTFAFGEPTNEFQNGDAAVCTMVNGEEIAGFIYGEQILLRTKNGITSWSKCRGDYSWSIR